MDHQQAGVPTLKDALPKIQDALYYEKLQPALRAYLTKLREDAYIKLATGYVDSGAAPGKDTRWKDVAQLKPQTITKEEVAARRKKKLLWVIPYGTAKATGAKPAPPPETTPVPLPPAKQ